MPELCISIALVAIGGMLWDAARRYMQLAHGRMLSADRSQTFERAITALDLSNKQLDHGLDQLKQRLDEHSGNFRDYAKVLDIQANKQSGLDVRQGQTDNIVGDIYKRIQELAANVGTLGLHTKTDADRMLTEIEANAAWRAKAEATFEKLSADIDKRDRAITNVAEELVVLKQQQTMALAGVANLPKHGFAGRPKT